MSSTTPQWSLHWLPSPPSHLLTWSTDIRLHRIRADPDPTAPAPSGCHRVANSRVVETQSTLPEPPHYIKCVAVQPKVGGADADADRVRMAVGQANGRISLLAFDKSAWETKEFSPRILRQCNDISWNSVHTNLLAGGFEKVRNDTAICVFDTEMSAVLGTVTTGSSRFLIGPGKEEKSEYVKAIYTLGGLGEACSSLEWMKKEENSFCIVAGMNGKNIKIFDVRSDTNTGKAHASTYTKAVYGVCVDPHLDHRIASYHENQVLMWDTRNFELPVVTLNQNHRITQLSFSPSRAGLLCSSYENSTALSVHEILSWPVMSEDGDPAVIERKVHGWPWWNNRDPDNNVDTSGVSDTERISSFAWHPQDDARIMAIMKEGRLCEVEVTERISHNWSPRRGFTWSHSGDMKQLHPNSEIRRLEENDISEIMRRRANVGYGEQEMLSSNGKMIQSEDPKVAEAWIWLEDCGKLMTDLSFKNKFSKHTRYPGVRTALGLHKTPVTWLAADVVYLNWNLSSNTNTKPKKVYRNENRERAMRLCGWSMDTNDLNQFIAKCEAKKEYCRAAAIATFCLEVKSALDILKRGSDAENETDPALSSSLNLTAISLSGFGGEDKDGLWTRLVTSNTGNMTDPYMRAMFCFLTATDDTYSAILDEPEIKLTDKIAFSCLYLSDDRLMENLNTYWRTMADNGDLSAILLCGMEAECVDLMQRYLDITGDVQTVSWLTVRCLPRKLVLGEAFGEEDARRRLQNPPKPKLGLLPQIWMEDYRELLDIWKKWMIRAEFDQSVNQAGVQVETPKQVYISCGFCGASIAQYLKGMPTREEIMVRDSLNKQAINAAGGGANNQQARVQACSSCKKHLMKCAICFITMGSHSGRMLTEAPPRENARQVTSLDNFFVWCQTCRHGGHFGHIRGWFKENSGCPVAGCSCPCANLDKQVTDMDESDLSDTSSDGSASEDDSEVEDLAQAMESVAVGATQTE